MRNSRDIIDEILKKRGITEEEDILEFLSDKPQRTYDPFLLDGMREGVDLLLSEIERGSRICLYGDYDADGVTAICVMSSLMRQLTDNWFYYIPSRFDEGYGLNTGAIDRIVDQGADLIITVDCGCVSYREVEYAKEKGLKVIVTDHHNIEDIVADCIVIDPKKPVKYMHSLDREYPCKDIAGCGVAFKFLQAVQREKGLSKDIINEVLDMVAVGTVGDVVPLRDENRTMVKYGTAIANRGRRKSLARLAEAISLKELNSENMAFGIVPHINACGRMDSAREAVELFISSDDRTIEEKIEKLIFCNRERKRVQEDAYQQCLEEVKGHEDFILLYREEMHEGIAGIVAGKLKEYFNRPVIIVTPSDEKYLKGTGRSIQSIDIYEVLNSCSHLFERFGGHRSACGFLMKGEGFDQLREAIESKVGELKKGNPDLFEKVLNADTEITPAEGTLQLAEELEILAPFGEGNPSPKFIIRDVIPGGASFMGDKQNHARFYVAESDASGKVYYLNCVLFGKAKDYEDLLFERKQVSLYGSLNSQTWKGRKSVQFIVDEIL